MRSENSSWGEWGSLGMNPVGTGRKPAPAKRKVVTKPEMVAMARARQLVEEQREARELERLLSGY